MDPAYILGIMASAVAGLFGWVTKLQYEAIRYRDRRIATLEQELAETNAKVESTVAAGNAATRQELAELRKTNAELVAALTRQESPK